MKEKVILLLFGYYILTTYNETTFAGSEEIFWIFAK